MGFQVSVLQDKKLHEFWRVEALNVDGDGEGYITLFAGTGAEHRARQYAQMTYGLMRPMTESEAEVIQHAMDWCEYREGYERLGQPTKFRMRESLEKLHNACAALLADCEGRWSRPRDV